MVREWEAEDRRIEKPQRTTVVDAWKEFLADAQARNLHESTIRKYELLNRQMEAFCTRNGFAFIDELSLSHMGQFRSEWKDGPRSSAKKLERLRSFFRFAQKRKWVPENPAADLKAGKITLCPTLPFTRDEMYRILGAAEKYDSQCSGSALENARRLRALVLLLRYSGMRIGDAVRMSASRMKGNRLFLYTQKTGVPVNTVLPPFVVGVLNGIPSVAQDLYFWDGTSKVEIIVGSWRRRLAKLFELAEVQNGHPHRFRDTFAVELLLAGVPIERVSVLLGHQSVRITERHYAPWVRSRQEQLEADLARAWSRDPFLLMAQTETAADEKLDQISKREVHAGHTETNALLNDTFQRGIFGGAGGNRTHA
ncbi:MAG TPA: tyrosine-type recombinase/integrase [Candidatus Acidoferrales bacterium]|nr:tyrosine-type recombinase/integrase [Candidatus Acidoferrales bacterium]